MSHLIQWGSAKLPVLLGGGILGISTVGAFWYAAQSILAMEAMSMGVGVRLGSAAVGAALAARFSK